jgi:hypothetical protein
LKLHAKRLRVITSEGEHRGVLRGVWVKPGTLHPVVGSVAVPRADRHPRRHIRVPLEGATVEHDTIRLAYSASELRRLLLRRVEHDVGDYIVVTGPQLVIPERLRTRRPPKRPRRDEAAVKLRVKEHVQAVVTVVRDDSGLERHELRLWRTPRVVEPAGPQPNELFEQEAEFWLYEEYEADAEE